MYKKYLDMSLTHTDGSHTGCARGGEAVEYQGRKKRKTVNSIYLPDAQGIPLGMSEPMEGKHNDMHEIEASMSAIFTFLTMAGISVDGIFNNVDAGFDGTSFHKVCMAKMALFLMFVQTIETAVLEKNIILMT